MELTDLLPWLCFAPIHDIPGALGPCRDCDVTVPSEMCDCGHLGYDGHDMRNGGCLTEWCACTAGVGADDREAEPPSPEDAAMADLPF